MLNALELFRSHPCGAPRRPLPPGSAAPAPADPFFGGLRAREAGLRLGSHWADLLGAGPALRGVHELGRGDRINLPAGASASVDASGGMTVSGASFRRFTGTTRSTEPGCRPRSASRCGCPDASGAAGLGGGALPQGLRLENGQVRLPDGTVVPFGNRGVIVRLPDGTQVAVGRDGDGPDAKACRWVVAGPGEDIPTNPPGATNLFDLDASGRLRPAGVK